MTDTTPRSTATAAAIAPPISMQVPRLADLRLFDKSSLISPVVVSGFARLAEFALVIALGLLIAIIYVPKEDAFAGYGYSIAILTAATLAVATFEGLGLYAPQVMTTPLASLARMVLGWSTVLAVLATLVFFLKVGPDFSRVWLAGWYAAVIAGLGVGRFALGLATRRWAKQGRLNRRAVIYGTGENCQRVIAALEADSGSDIRICGIFDDRTDERTTALVSGYPTLGRLDDLIAFSRQTRIDMVIMALPLQAEGRIVSLLKRMFVMPVDVRLAAVATKLRLRPRAYSFIGSVPMLDLYDKPIADWGTVAKWLFDKTIAFAALILLAPVMAAVALAIRLESRGPVLFRQKRYGFNNELIEIYKFRSMYTDKTDVEASRLVTKGDPRVTRVGRFIRKTSIDELPQLLNVLSGTLSLVGPRPHAVQAKAADTIYENAVEGYFARHKVKPGITGWAQINGWRGETDTEEKLQKRVEHDLYYIENWSLLLDLYILARTPFALLKTENAY
jgi:Undecaprenyl-phosphate glucose phosphotransferase